MVLNHRTASPAAAAAVDDDEQPREKREQVDFPIPSLTIKDLLSAIPAHCMQRSALRSSAYIVWDVLLLVLIYNATIFAEARIAPAHLALPHAALYPALRTLLWTVYGFAAGLVATGLWVIAHECGHQAFSESKTINNTVGWVLHSALGVPYHSWRITHAKHHAATGHATLDQVFVPRTRSELALPPLDAAGEDLGGASVSEKVKAELYEALGDSPLGTIIGPAIYLTLGWPAYIISNMSGQNSYPAWTSHFRATPPLYASHQRGQVLVSVLGVLLWLCALGAWTYASGPLAVARVYGVPYLWVNHWLVLITFLQHTDPLLPHYRAPAHTFARGALATLDRSLLGGAGALAAWVGATATHGISETHVLHHVCSKIPHYHAWAAAAALRARLARAGIALEGRPGGWGEVVRVYRECKVRGRGPAGIADGAQFIEDTGNVVFYKNAQGFAAARGVFPGECVSDSGVDVL